MDENILCFLLLLGVTVSSEMLSCSRLSSCIISSSCECCAVLLLKSKREEREGRVGKEKREEKRENIDTLVKFTRLCDPPRLYSSPQMSCR